MTTSVTRWVLAHKRIVAGAWIFLTLVGVATVGQATKSFSKTFSVPGREGFVTNQKILRLVHTGGDNAPLLPVVTLPAGTSVNSPQVRRGLVQIDGAARRALPGARMASYASTQSTAFVSADGRTTFAVVYPPPTTSPSATTPRRPSAPRRRSAAHDRRRARVRHRLRCPPEPDGRGRRSGRAGRVGPGRRWARCSCSPSCSPRFWPSCRC